MNKILQEYAELKIKETEVKNRLKEIKAEVSSLVFDEDDQKLETKWGRFELRNGRQIWKYSDELILKDNQVKEMMKLKKKEEEIKGIATLEKAPTNLVFTVKKN